MENPKRLGHDVSRKNELKYTAFYIYIFTTDNKYWIDTVKKGYDSR